MREERAGGADEGEASRFADWVIEHVPVTGSTNADLAARAEELPSGFVLTTDEQLAGRGRAGRGWECPAGAGLLFSALIRAPRVAAERRGWVGMALGVALVDALRDVAALPDAGLKWPNDVLIGDAKCAGILGEVAGDAVIVGCGVNVTVERSQLPRADATSLQLAGAAQLDRTVLLDAILGRFDELLAGWHAAAGDADASGLRAAYRSSCRSIGSVVRIELPGGAVVTGSAEDVDQAGSLVVRDDVGGLRTYSVGDVVHVRG